MPAAWFANVDVTVRARQRRGGRKESLTGRRAGVTTLNNFAAGPLYRLTLKAPDFRPKWRQHRIDVGRKGLTRLRVKVGESKRETIVNRRMGVG